MTWLKWECNREIAERMKISDIIRQQGRSISVEIFPPRSKEAEDRLVKSLQKLESLNISFISVTCGTGSGTSKNTQHMIKRIKDETSLLPMPHLTCISQGEEQLRAILADYKDSGIRNILALRGDPPEGGVQLTPPKDNYSHATDLIRLIASFKTFCIGVGVYPEGHIESPSLAADISYTKHKIEAGAEFAITQMFFENRFFYDFVEMTEKAGIHVPIIVGIMPITDFERINRLSQLCSATLPDSLVQRLKEASASPDEARKIGMEFTIKQCEELLSHNVRCLHFYSLNRIDMIVEIFDGLGLQRL